MYPRISAAIFVALVAASASDGLAGLDPFADLGGQGSGHSGEGNLDVESAKASPYDGDPDLALTLLEKDLVEMAAMVGTSIPPDAPWVLVSAPEGTTLFRYFQLQDGAKSPTELSGWLLDESDTELRVLDYTGFERRIPKLSARVLRRTLADEVGAANPDLRMPPQLLPAAWALERGDRKTAAALALPLYRAADDPADIGRNATEQIANGLQARLFCAFGRQRDFRAAESIARQLAGPLFDGNEFQKPASEIAEQMAANIGLADSHLPTWKEWKSLRGGMSHQQQLAYLLAQLFAKLPDDAPPQTGMTPLGDRYVDSYPALNSFDPEASDVEFLVPYLDDARYVPDQIYHDAFGRERECNPKPLRQVSWIAAALLNRATGFDQQQLYGYLKLDASARKEQVDRLLAWSRGHGKKSETDLLFEKLTSATADWERRQTAIQLAGRHDKRAFPYVLQFANEDPEFRERSVFTLYRLDSEEFVPPARQWFVDAKRQWDSLSASQKAEEASMTSPELLWDALILLRRGDRANLEGLDAIRSVLEADQGGWSYIAAWADLRALQRPEATEILFGVLDKPTVFDNLGAINSFLACRLFESGNARFIEIVDERLASKADKGRGYATMAGDRAANVTEGYRVAEMLAEWSEDGPNAVVWNWADPTAVRDANREKLERWFHAQHELQKSGQPNDIMKGTCGVPWISMATLPAVPQ